MSVNVIERTLEIGVLRAIDASNMAVRKIILISWVSARCWPCLYCSDAATCPCYHRKEAIIFRFTHGVFKKY